MKSNVRKRLPVWTIGYSWANNDSVLRLLRISDTHGALGFIDEVVTAADMGTLEETLEEAACDPS